jgi:hypothetical protein
MHQHKCLEGPVRGTPGWWQELGNRTETAEVPPPKKKRTKKSAPIRQDLVDRVKKEIAAGTYDTPEKWEATLDRLLDHLCE